MNYEAKSSAEAGRENRCETVIPGAGNLNLAERHSHLSWHGKLVLGLGPVGDTLGGSCVPVMSHSSRCRRSESQV